MVRSSFRGCSKSRASLDGQKKRERTERKKKEETTLHQKEEEQRKQVHSLICDTRRRHNVTRRLCEQEKRRKKKKKRSKSAFCASKREREQYKLALEFSFGCVLLLTDHETSQRTGWSERRGGAGRTERKRKEDALTWWRVKWCTVCVCVCVSCDTFHPFCHSSECVRGWEWEGTNAHTVNNLTRRRWVYIHRRKRQEAFN